MSRDRAGNNFSIYIDKETRKEGGGKQRLSTLLATLKAGEYEIPMRRGKSLINSPE